MKNTVYSFPLLNCPEALCPDDELSIVVAHVVDGSIVFENCETFDAAQALLAGTPGSAAVVTYGRDLGIRYTYNNRKGGE